MSEKEKGESEKDEMNTNRGGKEEGCTPNYERNQSPSTPQGEFDDRKARW